MSNIPPTNQISWRTSSPRAVVRTLSGFPQPLAVWTFVVALALFAVPGPMSAQVVWQGQDPDNNDYNGDFHVGANWVGGQIPEPPSDPTEPSGDIAEFNLQGQEFSVDFKEPGAFDVWRLYILNGNTTFDLNGETLNISDDSGNPSHNNRQALTVSGVDPVFILRNGTVDVTRRGTVGRVNQVGRVIVGNDGTLKTGGDFLVGQRGDGFLTVEANGQVETGRAFIGHRNGGFGNVDLYGSWTFSGLGLLGGSDAGGILRVLDGGTFAGTGTGSSAHVSISIVADSLDFTVLISGTGSTLSHQNIINVGNSTGTASPSIAVMDGGLLQSGSDLNLRSNARLTIGLTNNNMVQVGGALSHDGLIEIFAAPTLAPGDAIYTPVSVTGSWTGSGDVAVWGGIWDDTAKTFDVAALQTESSAGDTVTAIIDLASTQRLLLTTGSGQEVFAAFDPNATATGGGSVIDFEASLNPTATIGGFWEVLAAWDFDTDLAFGFSTLLSMDVGPGIDVDLFVWHSPDGNNWSRVSTDVFREGDYASFLVDGFSSYAITIPEPSATLLALITLGAWLARRRVRSHPAGRV